MTAPPLLTVGVLEDLRARWRARELAILTYLQPGLQTAEIREFENRVGYPFNVELQRWWGWQNGAVVPTRMIDGKARSISIHPGPELLSAERALEQAKRMRTFAESTYADSDPQLDAAWNPRWVPIALNSSGGLLTCEAGGDPNAACSVRYVQPGVTALPPTITAESLGQLVLWWIELYDRGLYYYDASIDLWLCDDSDLDIFPGPQQFRSFYASA